MMTAILHRLLAAAVFLALLNVPAAARSIFIDPSAKPKAEHPATYTVREGDTLWRVAALFLERPWRAGELMTPQAPQIFPGDQISLQQDKDQLLLQVKRGREVKLSPGARYPRQDRAIKIIPLDSVRQFLIRPQVAVEDELSEAPYIVATADARLLATEGNLIYARGLEDADIQTRYVLVRPGQAYIDPETQETLAHEAIYIGEAEIKHQTDPAVLTIVTALRGVQEGDKLLPVPDQTFDEDFYPRVPLELEGGHIIAVVDGLTQIGQYQVVVINKGETDDIERGHVLTAFRGGQWVTDKVGPHKEQVFLPSLETATLLIFQVFPKVSYGLVMKASDVVRVGDEVNVPR